MRNMLIPSLAAVSMLVATSASAIVISVDVESNYRWVTEEWSDAQGASEWHEIESQAVEPSSKQFDITVDMNDHDFIEEYHWQSEDGLQKDDGYFWNGHIEESRFTGPFYNELMSLVDLSYYEWSQEHSYIFSSSFFSDYGDSSFGSDNIALGFSIQGRNETIEDGLLIIDSFYYYHEINLYNFEVIESVDDLKLSSLTNIADFLVDNQFIVHDYGESISINQDIFDSETADYISSSGRYVNYSGNASYTIAQAPEPEAIALFLLAIGSVFGRRFRTKC